MSEQPESEVSQITFFLAKKTVHSEDIFDEDSDLIGEDEFHKIDFEVDEVECHFFYFVKSSDRRNPKWLDLINEKVAAEEVIVFSHENKNPNGVLSLKIQDRTFVSVFGRSALSHLDLNKFETDFGVITAMNMCGNEEIRETRSQSKGIALTQIGRQTSRPSHSFAYGMTEAEELKYISAHVQGEENITLQGRDRLTIKVIGKEKLSWKSLIKRCLEFRKRYESNDYKKTFPNYRNFQAATATEVRNLDAQLIETLRKKDYSKIDLCIPDFFPTEDFRFSYSNYPKRNNMVFPFLEPTQLDEVLKKNINDLTIHDLRKKKIFPVFQSDESMEGQISWTIYQCIVYECTFEENNYILNNGRWEKFDDNYYQSIVNFMTNQVKEQTAEPWSCDIDISDEKKLRNFESIFNKKVVERRPEAILFDRSQLKIGSERKNKEFCDILELTEDEQLRIINVKQFRGGSSIHYLFSQTRVYCEAFLKNETFFLDVRKHIAESPSQKKQKYLELIKPEIEQNVGQNYAVCLWLLFDRRKNRPCKHDLPLIAKSDLKLMYDQLRRVNKIRDIIIRFVPVQMINSKVAKRPNT